MTKQPDEEDEEKSTNVGALTRKAWFAGHADIESRFDSSYRGVPGVRHGGSKTVKAEHTRGSMDFCWCGLQLDHDWPGKALGRKHPPKEADMPATTPEEQPRIERRALRAYHADLADIILTAVNEYGTKYRITAHSVILYPLDQTKPYAINARNGERQVKGARVWFAKHCVPPDISIRDAKPAPSNKPVDEEAVKELAEMLNSEEHLVHDQPAEAQAETPQQPAKKAMSKTAKKVVAKKPPAQVAEETEEYLKTGDLPEQAVEEWVPYVKGKGKGKPEVSTRYVINGKGDVKCLECEGHPVIGTARSTGGHSRTHHTDTTTLWGPEAKNKATNTFFTNRATGQVEAGVKMIQEALGLIPPAVDTSAQDAETRELRAKNEALTKENGNLKMDVAVLEADRDDLKQKVADIETKQALAREALGL